MTQVWGSRDGAVVRELTSLWWHATNSTKLSTLRVIQSEKPGSSILIANAMTFEPSGLHRRDEL